MNTIMLRNKILFLIVVTLLVYQVGIDACNAQSQSTFKERVKQMQIINAKKIEPEVSQRGNITFSPLEKDFLQYAEKGKVKASDVVFYYTKNSKKGFDGLFGIIKYHIACFHFSF